MKSEFYTKSLTVDGSKFFFFLRQAIRTILDILALKYSIRLCHDIVPKNKSRPKVSNSVYHLYWYVIQE